MHVVVGYKHTISRSLFWVSVWIANCLFANIPISDLLCALEAFHSRSKKGRYTKTLQVLIRNGIDH